MSTAAPFEPDYESLLPESGPLAHLTAGALAGVAEHTIMYPLDLVKTRMQMLRSEPSVCCGIRHSLAHISRTEGRLALWRGVSAVFAGAAPAHALYFASYEIVKSRLLPKPTDPNDLPRLSPFSAAISGAAACILQDAVMNPFDVVKQRMQVSKNTKCRSLFSCAKFIAKNEGLGAFYVSYPASIAISMPFQAIHFACYEHFSHLLNPNRKYSPAAHLSAGAAAGAISAALTTPLDAIRTVLQTKGDSNDTKIRSIRGIRDAAAMIIMRDGLKGFSRGLVPRVLLNIPSAAVCWCTYEYFKAVLGLLGC